MNQHQRPRVAVLADASSPHLRKWILPFAEDFDIHVISAAPNAVGAPIQFHPLKTYWEPHLPFLLGHSEISKYMLSIRPHLLHCFYATSYGLLGAHAPISSPKLLSVYGSDIAVTAQKNLVARFMLKRALKAFSWINAPAHHMKDKLIRLGVPENKIEVFQYGVDLDRFTLSAKPLAPPFRLISVRGWDPIYRIENILAGFNEYCRKHNDVDLVLLGSGNKTAQKKIRSMAQNLPCASKCRIIGQINSNSLVDALSECHIIISIPKSDGAPLSLLEAMAVGLLPVVSDIAANREWVDPEHGVFVKNYTPISIASALEKSVHMIRNGYSGEDDRKIIAARADYGKNISRLKAVYSRFLSQPNLS